MLNNLLISTDPSLLDYDWLFRTLTGSHWGTSLTKAQILKAADKSICFGAYIDRQQIGFARVVSDHAIFSSVMDVIVGEKHRRQGVGRALMQAVVAHPAVAPTICILDTRYAADFYEKFAFYRDGTIFKREPT